MRHRCFIDCKKREKKKNVKNIDHTVRCVSVCVSVRVCLLERIEEDMTADEDEQDEPEKTVNNCTRRVQLYSRVSESN